MYDSHIAAASGTLSTADEQRLLENLENNSCLENSSGSGATNRYFNASAQVRWENSESHGKSGGGGGYHPTRTCYQSSKVHECNSTSNNGDSGISNPTSATANSIPSTMNSKMITKGGNIGNINNNKTVTSSTSSARNSVNQQQQQIYGALSRRLCRWSSDSNSRKGSTTGKSESASSKAKDEGSNERGADENKSPMMTTTMMMNSEKLLMNGKEQRPVSVNSVISSTSSSSTCSSESSISLSGSANGVGVVVGSATSGGIMAMMMAPRASPEEEDCATIPDADISDDEESSLDKCRYHHRHHNHHCAKKSNNNSNSNNCTSDHTGSNGTERCFSNSAAKDCGDSATRGQVQGIKINRCYDPTISYMDRVVMEIVETERIYATDLGEIISGYLEYWRDNLDENVQLDDVKELFSNIEQIHKFNSEFLKELEGCGLDPVKVAQCFVRKNEGFSIYTQYCTNYPRTMSILTELMRHEQSAKSFRERQAALGHSLPLGSYLLKPVQRILKYHLLLQNIVKTYDHEADGCDLIVDALSAMTNIAHHINDMKRRHEHAVRVQEIQSLLYGWQGEDLTTYGELCAEGTFRAYGAKALRHVFLFDKMLLITKKKEDGILSYKTHIMCSNLMLIESVPGEPLSFHVIPFDNPRFQSTLQARNLDQKREWTLQLKRVILENYHAVIPSHARQLVMELGQCRPEDENNTEKVPTKRQHSAPEYLERRKQERRKSESTLRARLRRARKSDPGSPKESPATSRRCRRTSVDSSRERSESRDREVAIDRKMSSASCPPSTGSTEKRLVKKLSGWRRKSEPGFYGKSNGKGENGNGSFMSPTHSHGASNYTLDSNDSIIGEVDGELEESASQIDSCQEENGELADIDEGGHDLLLHAGEERRESIEEIVGQLVMQNQEFRRILSKQRLVHLRKALAQHQQRNLHEEETASETETEEQPDLPGTPTGRTMKNGCMKPGANCILEETKPNGSNESEASSSNGIGGSSSDMMAEMSSENISIATSSADENLLGTSSNNPTSKNVQRTVSDPGNKATLTPRRFMNGPLAHYDPLSLLWSSFRRSENRNKHHHHHGSSPEKSSGKTNIRHTHSFTCSSSRNKDMGSISIPGQNGTELNQSKEPLPHGDSGVFPNSFTSDSSSSSEANIPTLPAVWLKQQDEHLATPNNKSGSLPRSFQVGQHTMPNPPLSPFKFSSSRAKDEMNNKNGPLKSDASTIFKSRISNGKYSDRPFTIASDKPSPSDISYDEMEQYMSKFNAQMARHSPNSNSSGILTTADEDVDDMTTADLTPVTSMENISVSSTVHPDHKIYRSSKSSIKHILLSVTQRLTGLKANMMTGATSTSTVSNGNVNGVAGGSGRGASAVNFGSYPNISSSSAAAPTTGMGSPDPNQIKENGGNMGKMSNNKGMHNMLPRNYRKSLKQKLRHMVKDDRDSDSENCESSVTCSSASSGFSSLGSCESSNHNLTSKIGARLAQSTEHSDYTLAKLLGGSMNGDGTNSRPRSVMSVSSTVTSLSSSTTDEKTSSDGNYLGMDFHDLAGATNGTCSLTSSTRSSATNNPTKDFYRSGRKAINHRDLYLSYIDSAEAHSDSDASADSFYERSFEAIESLLESEIFPDSAIYSDASSISSGSRGNNNWAGIKSSSSSSGSHENGNGGAGNIISSSAKSSPSGSRRRSQFHSQNVDINSVSLLAARLSNTRLPSGSNCVTANVPKNSMEAVVAAAAAAECIAAVAAESRRSRLVRSQVILEKLKHLEECSRFQRNEPPSPSFEGMKSIQERRKELDLWRAGMSNRGEDESETSSQHSTSTINTVIELSPSKSTSFPSSRRCSDTDSSGGNSPLTERAVSRNSSFRESINNTSSSCGNITTASTTNGSSNDPMPKGWVKLVVGKLQGGDQTN